jgi:hypothetical protein
MVTFIKKKKVICINFFAGPGAGKSTMSARIFSELKTLGVNCELVTEFAKRKVWEGNTTSLGNQLYITAKQQYHMWTVSQHVDLIVTDSPLLLGCIYGKDKLLDQIIVREFEAYENINIFLTRVKKYNPIGRTQTAKQAKGLDTQIKNLLKKHQYPCYTVNGDKDAVSKVMEYLLTDLNLKGVPHA